MSDNLDKNSIITFIIITVLFIHFYAMLYVQRRFRYYAIRRAIFYHIETKSYELLSMLDFYKVIPMPENAFNTIYIQIIAASCQLLIHLSAEPQLKRSVAICLEKLNTSILLGPIKIEVIAALVQLRQLVESSQTRLTR